MWSPIELGRSLFPISPVDRLRVEREIIQELQFHLDCLTETNRQCGLSADEAERTALIQFGDPESVLDACLAVREGHPGRRAARIVARVLPLGMACGFIAAVLLVLYSLTVRPPATYPTDSRWIVVWWEHESSGIMNSDSSVDDYIAWKSQSSTVESVAMGTYRQVASRFHEKSERLMGKYVADDYLRQHEIRPVIGRTFIADAPGMPALPAVISYQLWKRRYNLDRSVLGSEMDVDGSPYTIVGVTQEGYQTYFPFDFLVPLDIDRIDDWSARNYLISARLKPGVSAEQVRAEFALLNPGAAENPAWHVRIRRPQDVYGGDYPRRLIPYGILAFMLLAIAVTGLKSGLGVSRSGFPSMLAGVAAVAGITASGAITLLRNTVLAGADQRFSFGIDALVVTGFVALVALSVLVSEYRMRSAAKASKRQSVAPNMGRLSPALVLTNAMAFLMLVSAVVLTHNWWKRRAPDVGFDTEHVFVLQLLLPRADFPDREARRTFFRNAIERIDGIESVEQYSFALGFRTQTEPQRVGINLPDPDHPGKNDWAKITAWPVGRDYFKTIEIDTLEGSPFERSGSDDEVGLAVVNRAFAEKFWPDGTAIGRRLNIFEASAPFQITAIVENAVSVAPGDEADPILYPLVWHWAFPQNVVVRTRGDFKQVAQEIRSAVTDVDPRAETGEMTPADSALAASAQAAAMTAAFFWISALLSLVLSSRFTARSLRRATEHSVRMFTMNRAQLRTNPAFRPLIAGVTLSLVLGGLLSTPLSHLLIRELSLDAHVGPLAIVVPALLLLASHFGAGLMPYRQLSRLLKAAA